MPGGGKKQKVRLGRRDGRKGLGREEGGMGKGRRQEEEEGG